MKLSRLLQTWLALTCIAYAVAKRDIGPNPNKLFEYTFTEGNYGQLSASKTAEISGSPVAPGDLIINTARAEFVQESVGIRIKTDDGSSPSAALHSSGLLTDLLDQIEAQDSDFSLELWYKVPIGESGISSFVGMNNYSTLAWGPPASSCINGDGLGLMRNNDQSDFVFRQSSNCIISGVSNDPEGVLTHIVLTGCRTTGASTCVSDRRTCTYGNGVQSCSFQEEVPDYSAWAHNVELALGPHGSTDTYRVKFDYEIYTVAFYNKSLSQAEVNALYAQGLPNSAPFCPTVTASAFEDTDNQITLAPVDNDGDDRTIQITKLPVVGTLFEYNASNPSVYIPISTLPHTLSTKNSSIVIYKPLPGQFGLSYANFSYQATDGVQFGLVGTVTVNVFNSNDKPVPTNTTVLPYAGVLTCIQPNGTDIDVFSPNGDNITKAYVSPPTSGTLYQSIGCPSNTSIGAQISAADTLVTHSDRYVVYMSGAVPEATKTQTIVSNDTFLFKVEDFYGQKSDTGRIDISVRNSLQAVPVVQTVMEDTRLNFTLTAVDLVGGAVTYQIVSLPSRGFLYQAASFVPITGSFPVNVTSGGNVAYLPGANVYGSDSFEFQVIGSFGRQSGVSTLNFDITPVNDEFNVTYPASIVGVTVGRSDTVEYSTRFTVNILEVDPATDSFRAELKSTLALLGTFTIDKTILSNLTFSFGSSGEAFQMDFTGTRAAVQVALTNVLYSPGFAGTDTITVELTDGPYSRTVTIPVAISENPDFGASQETLDTPYLIATWVGIIGVPCCCCYLCRKYRKSKRKDVSTSS